MASGIDGDWFSFIPIMVEWFDTNMLSEKGMAKLKSIEPHSGGISLNADDFNDNVVIPCIVLESIGMGL